MNVQPPIQLRPLFALILLSLTAASSFADSSDSANRSISVVTSLGFELKQLQFSENFKDDTHTSVAKPDFDVVLPMINASATLSFNKWFTTLKYNTTVSTTETGTSEQPVGPGQYMLEPPQGKLGVERQDITLTVGYNVWDSLNVFAGYMDGKTTLTPNAYCSSFAITGFLQWTCNSANLAYIRQEFLAPNVPSIYTQEYSEKGPYVGASYAWNIADSGVLSASLAYAKMNGEYNDNLGLGSLQPNLNFSGDTTGTSIGLTWTAPLGESTSYYIDLRQQSYKMDSRDPTGNTNLTYLKSDETMNSLSAGLQVYF